ncbi:VanZ family protein [Methylomarinum vadi]|uniref:VanZ family protein n=1 Tax=Methylomarinum vadi TaxID=438855 RepID=UPI0004DFBDA5|nr:VanZ family protein [Methylomarinum vadi]
MPRNKVHTHPINFLFFAFIYAFFIIYGSLVPLDYHPKPIEQAWQSFKHIPYLNLGAASRADWIANIILYIPLTFSLAAYFKNKVKSSVQLFLLAFLILAFSLALAITIEFYQQFFPPRTVSLNDLIAETIGSMLGLVLGYLYGKRFTKLYQHILAGGKEAFIASAILYTISYFAISFFPYDFVTSLQELQDKLASENSAFLFASGCGDSLRCTVKIASEIVMAIPLGVFFSVIFKWHPQRLTAVMLMGFIFGVIIETVQVFLVSGVSQGLSIFTRIIGMGLGGKLYNRLVLQHKTLPTLNYRKYLTILLIPYLLLIANLNGWSLSKTELTGNIIGKVSKINWLPFYYHYYSTESVALTSLLSISLMYMPVGFGLWLWRSSANTNSGSSSKLNAGLFAAGLAVIMEAGKLFFVGKHPDPTNVLIGFVASYLAYSIAEVMYRWFHQPIDIASGGHRQASLEEVDEPQEDWRSADSDSDIQSPSSPLNKAIAIAVLLTLVWKLLDYPGNSVILGIVLLLVATVVYRYPSAWLIFIPALLPISNLAPWTGRLFFTELDFLVLTIITISYWRGRTASPLRTIRLSAMFLLGCYAIFYMISTLIGLLPLQPLDANAFSHYYSHYNSIRIAKGLFWSLCLLPILAYHHQLHNNKKTNALFTYGVLTGLSLTSIIAIWERIVFTGLLNFDADFRITSSFFSMHTGGAHLDAYLLLSMPFIALLFTDLEHKIIPRILALLIFSSSFYTLLVTFSRGSYIAFVVSFFILLLGLIICNKQKLEKKRLKLLWLPLFMILAMTLAMPVLKGSFIQKRFDQSIDEANIRSSHWKHAIHMMDNDFFTYLFGMGLGSFPRTYFWKTFDQTPATFSIQNNAENSFLELRGGAPLYIEQKIPLKAYTHYQLQFDFRTEQINGLNVQLCEKAIHHSFDCRTFHLREEQSTHREWQQFSQVFNSGKLGESDNNVFANLSTKPVKLVFNYTDKNNTVELKNIFLISTDGKKLIMNGNFANGMDHWFFTTDKLKPWRTENQWIQILFEQGSLGLLAFISLFIYVLFHLFREIMNQQFFAAILLSSIVGFSIITIANSPFDDPAITLLFFFILFISFPSKKTGNLITSRQ